MKTLQFRILTPPPTVNPVKRLKLGFRTWEALAAAVKKSNPGEQDLVGWIRRLPAGTTLRQELEKLRNVGGVSINELVELAVSAGMERTEIDLEYYLGKRPYGILKQITGKPSPLKWDFGDWIAHLPPDTSIRNKLLGLGYRRASADAKMAAVERLMEFAVQEGFMKPEAAAQKI